MGNKACGENYVPRNNKKLCQYRNVSFEPRTNKYLAMITKGGRRVCVGSFDTELEAAIASDNGFRLHCPNNISVRLNFPAPEPPNDVPNTRWIRTTKGKFTRVNDYNFEWLNKFRWTAKQRKDGRWYASRQVYNPDGTSYEQKMARLILGITDPNIFTDHKNSDGMDNYIPNIRPCTPQENARNNTKTKTKKCSSVHKGVCFDKQSGKWYSYIRSEDKKIIYLGRFDDEEEAARCYDFWAAYFYKDFAKFNFKDGIIKMLN